MNLINFTPDQLTGLKEMLITAKASRELFNRETFTQGVDYNFWMDEILKVETAREVSKRVIEARLNAYDNL
jgi:hypothetical protein